MRSTVNSEISTDAVAAPANACHAGTPQIMSGGAMRIVRATVQPISANPEPFFRSNMPAADLYVGSVGSDAEPKRAAIGR